MNEHIEATLRAEPVGAKAIVQVDGGEMFLIEKVHEDGWYLEGDLVVASADVAEGAERVWLLFGEDQPLTGEEF